MFPSKSSKPTHRLSGSIMCLLLMALLLLSAVGVGAKTTITVAVPWGDPTSDLNGVFQALADEYERLNPDIEIEFLPNWRMDRILAAWASGVLPDIIFEWGNNEEKRLIFRPLDDMMAERGIYLSDYLDGAARQMHILGQTWTLQVYIDPNFPLIYNKTLFEEAGLSGDHPPATIAEFDDIFPKLTRRDFDGSITQIAMPTWMWINEGPEFNAFTYGSAFGASLWEGTETEGRFGLTSPQMVEAYEWQKQYFDEYYVDAKGLVQDNIGSYADRMAEGTQAMVLWVTSSLKYLKSVAPEYEWGVAPPFYKEGSGIEYPIWFGGWSAGVTTQSKNPEAAFDFLAFMSHSPEGQEIIARVGQLFPATKESPGFIALVEEEPLWFDFINALKISSLAPATYWLDVRWDSSFTDINYRIFRQNVAPATALQEIEQRLILQAKRSGITVLD